MPDANETPRKTPEKWVSIAAAADVLFVSERTVKRWIETGEIKSKKQGRRRFVQPLKVTRKVTSKVTREVTPKNPVSSVIEVTSKVTPDVTSDVTFDVTSRDELVEQLRNEVARLDGHVQRLDGHVERLTMLVEKSNESLQREQQLHAETMLQLRALQAAHKLMEAQKITPTPFITPDRDAPISTFDELSDWLEKEILRGQ